MLRVNEIFETIQGEARWTGTPSVFIRLQGCPVGCPWCDTKHTWPAGSESGVISFQQMLEKDKDAPTFAEVGYLTLFNHCKRAKPNHYVITGGEPFAQDISDLTSALSQIGTVQVETSGTHPVKCDDQTWITLSPKIGMPGGFEVLPSAVQRANEIKMPARRRDDIEKVKNLLTATGKRMVDVWLQPISMGVEATDLCVDACLEYGYKLSIQTHKVANIR